MRKIILGFFLFMGTSLAANAQISAAGQNQTTRFDLSTKTIGAYQGDIGSAAMGGVSGGGGTGIYCHSGVPNMYLMLDTFEGRILNGYSYNQLNGLTTTQIIDAVKTKLAISKYHQDVLEDLIKRIVSKMQLLPSGVAINLPGDAVDTQTALLYPKDCQLVAIGYYQANGQLLVDQDAINGMSDFEKAIFLLHEAIYLSRRERTGGDLHQIVKEVRHSVATLVADQVDQSNVYQGGMSFGGFQNYDSAGADGTGYFTYESYTKNHWFETVIGSPSLNFDVIADYKISDPKNVISESDLCASGKLQLHDGEHCTATGYKMFRITSKQSVIFDPSVGMDHFLLGINANYVWGPQTYGIFYSMHDSGVRISTVLQVPQLNKVGTVDNWTVYNLVSAQSEETYVGLELYSPGAEITFYNIR